MDAAEMPVVVRDYKDRRTALLVLGILEIVLGLGAWLLAGLVVLGATMVAQQGMPMGSMVPGLLTYAAAGTLFIVLGVGSIRLRRWARALWLVVSGGWLVCGVLGLVFMAFLLPGLLGNVPAGQGTPPAAAMMIVMAVAFTAMTVLMFLIPLILFLFYRSPHVRATVEAAQPERAWTDACSLPVLGAALWLAVMALSLLPMPIVYGGLFPMMGIFVRGVPGYLLWWVVAGMFAVAAFGLYAQRVWAWWMALGLVLFFAVSSALTYAQADLREFYGAMGMAGEQMEALERMGFLRPGVMVGTSLGAMLPVVLLLLWARSSLRAGPRQ